MPRVLRDAALTAAWVATRGWAPHSRLFLVGDSAEWAIAEDMRQVAAIGRRLGVRTAPQRLLSASSRQAAFFGSQFMLLRDGWRPPRHALGVAYFHGLPGTDGYPEFDECFHALQRHHGEIDRVQVSHGEMRDVVLSSGIDPAKVHTIRIGVDLEAFGLRRPGEREEARRALGIPASAFAVGSFQKDGVGWGGPRAEARQGP